MIKPSKLPRTLGYSAATAAGLLLVAAGPALAAPVTQPRAGLPDGLQDKVNSALGVLLALVIAACVAGVFICAAKLVLAYRRGEAGEAAAGLAAVAAGCVIAGSAAGIVNYFIA